MLRESALIPHALAWRSSKAGSQTRIGSQAARTAGSSAAFSAISGPMPAGSPTGIAILMLAAHAHSHGISEAWITSGTPSLPTERMARSTSFKPNLCVVISSSGKRFDAICSSASSHAL